MTKVASNTGNVASQLTTYTLHLNATQAATISLACEVLGRLGMGQFKDALECLPTREFCADGWHEDMDAIGHILKKYSPIWGMGTGHGISHRETTETSKVAWDLYQVTRHRLSWDTAQESGHPGECNAPPPTWTVNYDKPMKTSKEPLAWMEKATEISQAAIEAVRSYKP